MHGVEHGEIGRFVVDLYACLGDRSRFDAHLDPDITIWESDAGRLLHGLAALDELRAARAARPRTGSLAGLGPEELTVDVWGDSALARYVLRARYHGDGPDDLFRVTDVLRLSSSGWRIVHHHAEAVR